MQDTVLKFPSIVELIAFKQLIKPAFDSFILKPDENTFQGRLTVEQIRKAEDHYHATQLLHPTAIAVQLPPYPGSTDSDF